MKERLDVMMVQRGLAPSREKAKAVIMAGEVLVDGQREDKPGTAFAEKVTITVKGNPIPVSYTHLAPDISEKSGQQEISGHSV